MRVLCRAAVLVLLGLSLGTPGVFAAKARVEGPRSPEKTATRGAVHLALPWNLFASVWVKAGCTIDPLGFCGTGASATAPSQDADAGCVIDPWGRCSPGH